MAMSADLGPRLESIVDELVTSGRYGSKSEVLREGVRLVHERESKLADLLASIDRGLADADAGRTRPLDEVAEELIAEIQKRQQKTDAA